MPFHIGNKRVCAAQGFANACFPTGRFPNASFLTDLSRNQPCFSCRVHPERRYHPRSLYAQDKSEGNPEGIRMARDSQAALIALNRFGFGARGGASGDFVNAASDPRGFVKAGLSRPNGVLLEMPGLASTPALA